MNTLTPEYELIALAKAGNSTAFDTLARRHLGWVKSGLARFRLRPEDCDDIIQSALISAWHGIPAYRGEAAFRTWLYRIAANAANGHFKSTASRFSKMCVSLSGAHPDDNDHAQIDIAYAEAPDQILEAQQRLVEVQRLLQNLPPSLARTFELRTAHGLAYAEIAEYLDIPVGTVRSRISRARAALGLLPE